MYQYRNKEQIGTSDPSPEPSQPYDVHCGHCHWWGYERQLKTIYKVSNDGYDFATLGCPMCESDYWLEYRKD